MSKKNKSQEQVNENLNENSKQKDSCDVAEVHQAFIANDEATFKELEKRRKQPEEFKAALENAGKVRARKAILSAIDELIIKHKRMPSAYEITIKTGYSLKTIYKHLKELNSQGYQDMDMKIFSAHKGDWLSVLMRASMPDADGKADIKAIKMCLDVIAAHNKNTPSVSNINTAIQIVLAHIPKEQQEKVRSLIQLPVTNVNNIDNSNITPNE